MADTVTIHAPNEQHSGLTGGVQFDGGQATVDADDPRVQWFARRGYGIDEPVDQGEDVPPEEPDVDPRELPATSPSGTRLRDAAVDPEPDRDAGLPTNAGEANPHGPRVVSPGVHEAHPARIPPDDAGPPLEEIVSGSVDDVLAWVGDDPVRARLALEAEQEDGKGRKTLVGPLEKLAASEEEGS